MAEDTIHVVMLPWSAFGHLIPFFQLSIALAKAGIHVSYISTPKNIQRLPQLPSNLAHLIDLVELPLPSLDTDLLPEGAEATIDIPFEKIQYLKLASDQLQHPVKQLVAHWLPDWIICDFSPHWIVEIAQEFQVKLIFNNVLSAATLVLLGPPDTMKARFFSPESLTVPPEWVTFPSSVAYKRNEAIAVCAGANQVNASGISDCERLAKQLVGKPVIPIGLLPVERPQGAVVDGSFSKIFEWLDKQASKSIIFVGFGSECKLSKDQVYEIAFGLEMSELPFLWALRKPSWARFGHRSERNEDGSFTRNDIAKSLRQAMVSEEGEKLRIKTREAAAIVGNLKLHQDHYIGGFVQFLKNGIWKQI
ncbi:UDP-glycosyltransferase [Sesbania bispinosa]|nr:UDP-glycosyltransferase [Sesbania bispinosa]